MEKKHYIRIVLSSISIFCVFSFLIGCSAADQNNKDDENTDTNTTVSGKLIAFSSNEEMLSYMRDQYSESVYSDYSYAITERSLSDASESTMGGSDSTEAISYDSPSADETGNYTGTNLQEEGVDESDLVKTDGKYLYIASNDTVNVVDATDPMTIISTIEVNGPVDSMYLYNDILILLYVPSNYEGMPWLDSGTIDTISIGIAYWIPVQAKTGIAFFNMSDPSAPEELKTIEADGYLVSSRRIENHLHLVQQFLPNLTAPYLLEDHIETMTIEDLVPFYSDVTGSPAEPQTAQLVSYEDFYHPSVDGGASTVTVMTFDLDNLNAPFTSTGVVADASVVYASTLALYCTSTYWNWAESDPEQPTEQTIIYKFDLTGEQVQAKDYISVNGRILNQFSLGEYQDVLRIATTTGWSWGGESSKNHLYCIKSENDVMEIIGRLEDLAPGEELYSARFIGPRGYLVTFLRIDPLFTLDLSDPTAPEVAGELEVPGYSTYIHPWGDDLLITIGMDATDDEEFTWYQGVKLSIFNISDLKEPELVDSVIIGNKGTSSYSEALYNHKAFTFYETNHIHMLAIPIDLYDYEAAPTETFNNGGGNFKGLYVYNVGIEDGFELIGRIATLSELDQYWYYYGDWTRGIFIDEKVYAVTPEVVKSADINDIEGTIQSLEIRP